MANKELNTIAINGEKYDIRDDSKQDTLVSGSNIRTINGVSVLGSGNISISQSVDASLSMTSTNPVQNKAVAKEFALIKEFPHEKFDVIVDKSDTNIQGKSIFSPYLYVPFYFATQLNKRGLYPILLRLKPVKNILGTRQDGKTPGPRRYGWARVVPNEYGEIDGNQSGMDFCENNFSIDGLGRVLIHEPSVSIETLVPLTAERLVRYRCSYYRDEYSTYYSFHILNGSHRKEITFDGIVKDFSEESGTQPYTKSVRLKYGLVYVDWGDFEYDEKQKHRFDIEDYYTKIAKFDVVVTIKAFYDKYYVTARFSRPLR